MFLFAGLLLVGETAAFGANGQVELTVRLSLGNACGAGRFERIVNTYADEWVPGQDVHVKSDTENVDYGLQISVTNINGRVVDELAWAGHPLALQHEELRDQMGDNIAKILEQPSGLTLEDFPNFADSETDNFRGDFWDNLPTRRQGGDHDCPDQCQDDASFYDEQNVMCADWQGLDCYGAVADWGYSEYGMAQVLTKCCRTCTMLNSKGPSKVSTEPTASEKSDITLAYSKLWDLDNRLVPGVDYVINPQRYTSSGSSTDQASQRLFASVQPSVFERPTFKTFLKLMDNYEARAGVAESVSSAEKSENSAFLDASLKTPVMEYVYNYLKAKSLVSSQSDFKRQLDALWFTLFKRSGSTYDSSGFEHVFVGEAKAEQISGMHNWIQLYNEEKADRLDYQGYIRRGGAQVGANDHLLTIQFEWNDVRKPISSSLIGTTPEFELALYSLCYFATKGGKSNVWLGDYSSKVVCYKNGYGSSEHLGSAWVEQ